MTVANAAVPKQIAPRRENDDDESVTLEKDEIFHLLRNERRRAVLRYLEGVDDCVAMRDVAEQVAAWEHDTTVDELRSKQRSRVYIALYQDHLPALDKLGVIEYDQSRGRVRRLPAADQLTPHLDIGDDGDEEATDESADPWSLYYLAATGLSAGILVLSTLYAVFPSQSAGLLIFSLFSLVTGLNLMSTRASVAERPEV
ncbi:MAG: hypothetical protein ABEJ28_07455 [Salinigranum sp.]